MTTRVTRLIFCTILTAIAAGTPGRAAAVTVSSTLTGSFVQSFSNRGLPSESFASYFGDPFVKWTTHQVFLFELDTARGLGKLTANLQGELRQRSTIVPVTAQLSVNYTGLSVGTDPVTGQQVVAIGREPFNLFYGYGPGFMTPILNSSVIIPDSVQIRDHTYDVAGDAHAEVPEPASLVLLGMGMLGAAMRRRSAADA